MKLNWSDIALVSINRISYKFDTINVLNVQGIFIVDHNHIEKKFCKLLNTYIIELLTLFKKMAYIQIVLSCLILQGPILFTVCKSYLYIFIYIFFYLSLLQTGLSSDQLNFFSGLVVQ